VIASDKTNTDIAMEVSSQAMTQTNGYLPDIHNLFLMAFADNSLGI